MNIKEFGGEFKLIEKLSRTARNKNVIVGIGDDAAVVKFGNQKLIITSDMMCEDEHFSTTYYSPKQIGIKAMASNLSDIAAMGARPLYAIVSISLSDKTTVEVVGEIYRGLYQATDAYNVDIIGGDTTHASILVINITLFGETDNGKIITRAGARPGDVIKVTGPLGGSEAGLRLLKDKVRGFERVKKLHTEPSCRLDISDQIAHYATAMADISDGLASDLRNICKSSGVGAIINREAIPVADDVKRAALLLGTLPADLALYGGEDYELLYTLPENFSDLVPGVQIGKIISNEKIYLDNKGERTELTQFGFDHFL
ncbi:MAG: thiamine-phosphate kinase [Actinobacteria bacterium]|nr:thiamine-phosphate kinase [Actinomycetota bacterium]